MMVENYAVSIILIYKSVYLFFNNPVFKICITVSHSILHSGLVITTVQDITFLYVDNEVPPGYFSILFKMMAKPEGQNNLTSSIKIILCSSLDNFTKILI